MREDTRRWLDSDFAHCWHPFTRQRDWCAHEENARIIVRGDGAWLWDSEGRRYLDGNSSIWTNIHGHAHPRINLAISEQLGKISHSSFLGYTHPLAIELSEQLCSHFPAGTLERVFYSDDGSTAIECALKMALQYRQQTAQPHRNQFVTFSNSYHGDTLGAASLGGVPRFSNRVQRMGYPSQQVRSLDELRAIPSENLAAVLIEPLIQGVNEMRPWPIGMLVELKKWCDQTGVHLILDEVMTGFGRTGTMFACQQEQVTPDFLCLAKGLTGGYMPLAATLTTQRVYDAFLGDSEKVFYYGHSYTANPLGCAAALANLAIFHDEQTLNHLAPKISHLTTGLHHLKNRCPLIYETRQCGFIAGIEIRRPDGEKFAPQERMGEVICHLAQSHGLLTRPILDTLVIMLPLCASFDEIDHALSAIEHVLLVIS